MSNLWNPNGTPTNAVRIAYFNHQLESSENEKYRAYLELNPSENEHLYNAVMTPEVEEEATLQIAAMLREERDSIFDKVRSALAGAQGYWAARPVYAPLGDADEEAQTKSERFNVELENLLVDPDPSARDIDRIKGMYAKAVEDSEAAKAQLKQCEEALAALRDFSGGSLEEDETLCIEQTSWQLAMHKLVNRDHLCAYCEAS